MKNKLFDFYEELSTLSFDKRKVQGLVKRANTAGYDLYYAYHEDAPDTWRKAWSSNEYKNEDSDVKIFEATNLVMKNKGGGNFKKGTTYTAECAIFIFCPLSTLLQDENLREIKITSLKSKSKENAIADYKKSVEIKSDFDKWNLMPNDTKAEIEKLINEIDKNFEQPGSRKIRQANENRISELGGYCPKLSEWHLKALEFASESEYIIYKQELAVHNLLKEFETV